MGYGNYAFYCDAGTCNGVSSDRRLKKDVEPITDGLDVLMKLKPITFLWKREKSNAPFVSDDTKKAQNYGFIAQDVLKVLPDVVGYGMPMKEGEKSAPFGAGAKDKYYYALDYDDFIAPTVSAVQQLKHLIDDDQTAIAGLKSDNDNLRAELKAANDNFQTQTDELRREIAALKKEVHAQ